MFQWLGDKLSGANLGELIAPTQSLEEQLHTAIEQGAIERVKRLLDEEKVSAMAQSPSGNAPLHTAAYHGNVDAVELLLGMSVEIGVPGRGGNTALHFAASQGHEAMVRLLVEKGANAACKNQRGKTAYDSTEHTNIRQFLLPLQFQNEGAEVKAAALASLPAGVEADGMEQEAKPLPPPPPTGPSVMYGTAASVHDRPIQADGFGTSVGNAELSAKYGNTSELSHPVQASGLTAPPSMPAPSAPSGAGAPAPSIYTPGARNPYLAQGRYGMSRAPSPSAAVRSPASGSPTARAAPCPPAHPLLVATHVPTVSYNAVDGTAGSAMGAVPSASAAPQSAVQQPISVFNPNAQTQRQVNAAAPDPKVDAKDELDD